MSPKLRTRQRPPKRPAPTPHAGGESAAIGEPRLEGLFWVKVTDARNAQGLLSGQHLTLYPGDNSIAVFRGVVPLGVLDEGGRTWVESHGWSSCTFVKYGSDPRKRFQVLIVAG